MSALAQREHSTQNRHSVSALPSDHARARHAPVWDPFHMQQQAWGNQVLQRRLRDQAIQAKLRVDQPGDKYEQEADRVADQVVNMPEISTIPRQDSGTRPETAPTKPLTNQITPLVRPEAIEEEEKEEQQVQASIQRMAGGRDEIQPKGLGTAVRTHDGNIRARLAAGQGAGQTLPARVQSYMTARLGADFSGVRVHTDSAAARMSTELNARAFTHGRDIYFNQGNYDPDSSQGLWLLTHELTHVMQQGRADPQPTVNLQNLTEKEAQEEKKVDLPTKAETAHISSLPLQAESPAGPEDSEASEALEVSAEPEASAIGPAASFTAPVSLPEPPATVSVPGPLTETPSAIGQQFNTMPPSAQAEAYTGLGPALDASFANEAAHTQEAVPDLSASLEGVTELPVTPGIVAPAATPSAAGQIYAVAPEPVVEIPEAPAQAPVSRPDVPAAPPAEAGSLDEALGTIDPAPTIKTTLAPPKIPLEGKADPAALDTLESAAAGEAGRALGDAQAGVADVSREVVQPVALNATVPAPELAKMEVPGEAPQVEGMEKLASYALGPLDRATFDAQVGPSMQEATAGAQAEFAQREQEFDQERAGLHLEADAEAAAAQAEAQANQELEVEQGRQALVAEQQRTLDQQQAAVDGALGELSASREADARKIDDRLAADREAVDEVYAEAEADAQAEVEQGTAKADEAEHAAADQAEAESWWDWAIDTFQALVQMVADVVVAIWESVTEAVAGYLDRALEFATRVVNAAVAFVKQVLTAYFDLWLWLIDNLLGSVFPKLASAFAAYIDNLKATVFAALDAAAAFYLQALRFVADKLVAALYLALEAYKAYVAAYLALWEAIQNGQWADIGRTMLSVLLTAVGIDPEEFFATFSKIDEVIDDVIADPTLIGRRAIDALSLGFHQFGTNFIGNFVTAFVEWITGATGIVLPKTFSIAGIFDVVCQVLNLTYDYLREKAVQHLGEGAVTAVEELTEAVWTFVSSGWEGLWKLVKDKLTTLVDDVVIAMGTWLVEKAILVAGRWIAGLIATMGWSAIVEGLIALWQFIMWVKDQFQQFWQIVKSTIDSVHEFVKGMIQPAADTIEGTLQDLIVPAIDLVAKLLNLGNIAKKVEQIIESVREMIDGAIDGFVGFMKKKLGLGGKDKKGEDSQKSANGASISVLDKIGKQLVKPPGNVENVEIQASKDLAVAIANENKILSKEEAKISGKIVNVGKVQKDSKVVFNLSLKGLSKNFVRELSKGHEDQEHETIIKNALKDIDEHDTGADLEHIVTGKKKLAKEIIGTSAKKIKKGLKFELNLTNEETFKKDQKLKWEGKISPNTTKKSQEEEIKTFSNNYQIKERLPKKPAASVKVLKRKRKGRFFEPQNDNDKPKYAYIANVAAIPSSKVPISLANKYRDEGFTDPDDAKERFSMVIGLNLFENIYTREGNNIDKLDEGVEKTSAWDEADFPLGVFAFTWRPFWETKGNDSVDFETVEQAYENGDDEYKTAIGEAEKQAVATIHRKPFGVWRDQVKNDDYTDTFIDEMSLRAEHVNVHVGDPDVVSLKAVKIPPSDNSEQFLDPNFRRVSDGLFTLYDRLLDEKQSEEQEQLPHILSGGFQFFMDIENNYDPNDIPPHKLATIAANMLDMRVRQAMANVNPRAVYYPEPNLLINVDGNNKQYFLQASFGIAQGESKEFIKTYIQQNEKAIIQFEDLKVETDSGRFEVKAETTGNIIAVNNQWFVGILKPNLEAIRTIFAQSQSHADSQKWSRQVQAGYGLSGPAMKVIKKIRLKYANKIERLLRINEKENGVDPIIEDIFTKEGKLGVSIKSDWNEEQIRQYLLDELKQINLDHISITIDEQNGWKSELMSKGINMEEDHVPNFLDGVQKMAKATYTEIKNFLIAGLSRRSDIER